MDAAGDLSLERCAKRAGVAVPVAAAALGALLSPLAAAALAGSAALKGVLETTHLRAQVDAALRHIGRVERRLGRRMAAGELCTINLEQRMRDPDFLLLLAEARDRVALVQYESRLQRHAAVLAGRVVRPERDMEPDLRLAQAAIRLPDAAIEVLGFLRERLDRQEVEGERKTQGPIEMRTVDGSTSVNRALRRRKWADASAVNSAADAVQALLAHSLITRVGAFAAGCAPIRCADGSTAYFHNDIYVIAPWGIELLREIDAAADPRPPAA